MQTLTLIDLDIVQASVVVSCPPVKVVRDRLFELRDVFRGLGREIHPQRSKANELCAPVDARNGLNQLTNIVGPIQRLTNPVDGP